MCFIWLRSSRNLLRTIHIPVSLLVFAGLVAAQEQNTLEHAKQLLSTALLSYRAGDYLDAVAKDTLALQIENNLPDVRSREKAIVENNLALALFQLSRLRESERLQTDAVALFASDSVNPDLPFLEALNTLATIQVLLEKLDAAEQNATQALRLATLFAPESEHAAKVENTLGYLELHRMHLAAARQYFETALQIWTKVKGPDSVEYAATLTNLGSVDSRSGHHKHAEAQYRTALGIDEVHLGPNHPRVASDLRNVAAELFSHKQWDQSLQLFERAKTIEEKSFGPDSAPLARTWHAIGIVNARSKHFDEAGQAYANAIAAFKVSPAADDPEFALCLREYAVLLRNMQRFSDAEQAEVLATRIQVTNALR